VELTTNGTTLEGPFRAGLFENRLDKLWVSFDGADRILVSNVLPYSAEMEKEMLCLLTLSTDTFTFAPGKVEMSLPRLDVSPVTRLGTHSRFAEAASGLRESFNVPDKACVISDNLRRKRWRIFWKPPLTSSFFG
jgi:hypothetical protein